MKVVPTGTVGKRRNNKDKIAGPQQPKTEVQNRIAASKANDKRRIQKAGGVSLAKLKLPDIGQG